MSKRERSEPPDDDLVAYLQRLTEQDLIDRVLRPFLDTWGFERIEFNGGPGERGRDLIGLRKDHFGDTHATVFQIKRYKPTRRSADRNSISEIVNQLSEAQEAPVYSIDGIQYKPDELYFITPYPITQRALELRVGSIEALRSRRLKLIDGPKLASALRSTMPQLVQDLLAPSESIFQALSSELNNRALMTALQSTSLKDLRVIYTDIDFCLSRPKGQHLLLSPLPTQLENDVELALEPVEWVALRAAHDTIKSRYHFSVVEGSFESIESRYVEETRAFALVRDLRQNILSTIEELQSLGVALDEFSQRNRQLITQAPTQRSLSSQVRDLAASLDAHIPIHVGTLVACAKTIESAISQDRSQSAATTRAASNAPTQVRRFLELVNTVSALHRERSTLPSRSAPKYRMTFRRREFVQQLRTHRAAIVAAVNQANEGLLDILGLRAVIEDTHELMKTFGTMLSLRFIATAIGHKLTDAEVYSSGGSSFRVKVPLNTVLASGIDVLVLGEAGAGKTTALMKYAWDNDTNNRLHLFAPLTELVGLFPVEPTPNDSAAVIQAALSAFLNRHGIQGRTVMELWRRARNGEVTFLFDGVDEAIARCPELCDYLCAFRSSYSHCQFVVSSRLIGSAIDQLPMPAVTMMRFTDSQKVSFINKWFHDEPQQAKRICEHMEGNAELAEIIASPLNATVLCALAEKGVALPTSELQLHRSRMRLLTGGFDDARRVSRVMSDRIHLEQLARRVAFALHRRRVRWLSLPLLEDEAQRALGRFISEDECRKAIHELIIPCNILVPMTEDGDYGFGHLRYQEFLAAESLAGDRTMSPSTIISNAWWHDSLLLFARIVDDLEPIVAELGEHLRHRDEEDAALQRLHEMIMVRPYDEHEDLLYVLNTGKNPRSRSRDRKAPKK